MSEPAVSHDDATINAYNDESITLECSCGWVLTVIPGCYGDGRGVTDRTDEPHDTLAAMNAAFAEHTASA